MKYELIDLVNKGSHSRKVLDPSLIVKDGKDFKYLPGNILDANSVIEEISNNTSFLPSCYVLQDDGIYQIKDTDVYPISHPDLSTQPSILPQRFGNLPIKEVLIANGKEDEIPSDATVISAWSFNNKQCCAAIAKKQLVSKEIKVHSTAYLRFGFLMSQEYLFINTPIPIGDSENAMHISFIDTRHVINTSDCLYVPTIIVNIKTPSGQEYHNVSLHYYPYNHVFVADFLYDGFPIGSLEETYNSNIGIRLIKSQNDPNEYTLVDIKYKDVSLGTTSKTVLTLLWNISNNENIVPKYTLVRYIDGENNYYTEHSETEDDSDFTVTTTANTCLGFGTIDQNVFNENLRPIYQWAYTLGGVQIGVVRPLASDDLFPLYVLSVGFSFTIGTEDRLYLLNINTQGDSSCDAVYLSDAVSELLPAEIVLFNPSKL